MFNLNVQKSSGKPKVIAIFNQTSNILLLPCDVGFVMMDNEEIRYFKSSFEDEIVSRKAMPEMLFIYDNQIIDINIYNKP